MSVNVVKERCPQNHKCPAVRTCKFDALHQTGNAAPVVDQDKCKQCGICVDFCPMGALQLQGN